MRHDNLGVTSLITIDAFTISPRTEAEQVAATSRVNGEALQSRHAAAHLAQPQGPAIHVPKWSQVWTPLPQVPTTLVLAPVVTLVPAQVLTLVPAQVLTSTLACTIRTQ
eukprot:COSAG06_NODE_29499_length_555_cov_1.008772_2_plen_109_part_00